MSLKPMQISRDDQITTLPLSKGCYVPNSNTHKTGDNDYLLGL